MKHRRLKISSLLRVAILSLLPVCHASAEEKAKPASSEAKPLDDQDWPQVYQTPGHEVAIFQPQIHDWKDYRIATARMAVGVKTPGSEEIHYGAMSMEATTIVDLDSRTVTFTDRKLTSLTFPDTESRDQTREYRAAVRHVMDSKKPTLVNLERVLANIERTIEQERKVEINLDPPPIYHSETPAIMIMFMGKPRLEPIKDTNLFFASNTNWDLFFEQKAGLYFLLNGNTWLSTSDIAKGPWHPTDVLPKDFLKLPDTENWKTVRTHLQSKKSPTTPKVIVVEQPSELIITEGAPAFSPIGKSRLLYVTNTEQDLFMLDKTYYFLVAGRWFSTRQLDGTWAAATHSLPGEFLQIPESHEKGYVLASVPGTPEAEEAVILAQIPKTAKVKRDEAKLEVTYDGDPEFVPIPETDLQYAINTSFDVFQVEDTYYCCKTGVWFQASSPHGHWTVCSEVPDSIYTIPASSPKHNVTYVQVYDSTPDVVTVGYTSGYSGSYVVGNAIVFGVGVWLASEIIDHWDDHYWHHWHHHCPPHYYAYGCGAHYDWYSGGFYRASYASYGPYGGIGRGAVYNPATGAYARGATAWGPRGGAFAREAYNPWTDTYAARAGAKTPYGSWGRSVVTRDDEWARAGHRSNWKGTAYGLETSKGGKLVGVDRKYGSDGFIGKSKNDDIYVGRNGNLYKRDEDGNWDKRQNGKWGDVDKPDRTRPGQRPSTTDRKRPSTADRKRPSTADRKRPSTADRKRPSTTDRKRPTRPTTRPTPKKKPQTRQLSSTEPRLQSSSEGTATLSAKQIHAPITFSLRRPDPVPRRWRKKKIIPPSTPA